MKLLDITIDRIIAGAGDWNAQLFKELKCRLQKRNVLIGVLGSLLTQGIIIYLNLLDLPLDLGFRNSYHYSCQLNLSPLPIFPDRRNCLFEHPIPRPLYLEPLDQIHWEKWWGQIFMSVSEVMAIFLLVGGVYLLAKDLRGEYRGRTLDCIRLSPLSCTDFLMGKLLGVPVLIYLTVITALPIHVLSAVYGGFGWLNLLLWDLLWLLLTLWLFFLAILMREGVMVPFVFFFLVAGMYIDDYMKHILISYYQGFWVQPATASSVYSTPMLLSFMLLVINLCCWIMLRVWYRNPGRLN